MKKNETNVRPSYVDGQFYPRQNETLATMIDDMIDRCEGETVAADASVWGVIVPHAGYIYSGQTAVKTMLALRGRSFRRIVVIAPSHRYPVRGLALTSLTDYQTPLGKLPVDTAAMTALADLNDPLLQVHDDSHRYEHALEVELPLLQHLVRPGFELLPLICGFLSLPEARHLAECLQPLVAPDTLWVVSSDFTHFGSAFHYTPFQHDIKANLERLDLGAVERVRRLDADGFDRYLHDTRATICGAAPIKLLLCLARLVEPQSQVELCEYTTSGAMTGDYSHCVSYVGLRLRRPDAE